MPYTTTATELQRNYKKVVKKAKDLGKPVVILSNSQPEGIYLDYKALQDRYELIEKKKKSSKSDFSEFLGIWTKEEADAFDRNIDEAFEQVDLESWK